ncbi:hypothetical protein [Streptomyces sp. NPDC002779]|uniref:hypothetical protein n=1 Tax=Streptomyces sp. NPDC002779 TaxID=3364664 RepID=UPI0036B6D40B
MTPVQHPPESVRARIVERFADHVRLQAAGIDPELPFPEYCLDSVGAVGFAADIEETERLAQRTAAVDGIH